MRKTIHKLHLYLGLIAGITIFISCLTGAILAFQDEIRELTNPERYFRPKTTGIAPLPLNTLVSRVEAQLPEGHIESIEIPTDTTYNYIFTPSEPRKTQIYVNPYNGEITGQTDRKTPDFFGFILKLHRWLLDDSKTWGKQIMGASTLLFVLILISGIVYWFPKTKKQLKARLTLKTDASRYRLMSDLHAVGGIYAVSLLLVMALTGLTWSYPWYRSGLYALLGIDSPKEGDKHGKEGRERHGERQNKEGKSEEQTVWDWDKAYASLRNKAQTERSLSIGIDGKAGIARKISFGYTRANDEYTLNRSTYQIEDYTAYDKKPIAMRARTWIYILHVGMWAGVWSKALYCIACLLGASFPITGLYLYLKKRGAKSRKKA